MSNADNVVVGITGAVYVAATSATAPSSATSALTGFTDLGYLSTDGITVTPDKSANAIRAWQNADLVREVVTESTLTYQFMLLETTVAAIEAYFGSVSTNGFIELNPSNTGGKQSFVFDVVDGNKTIRHYVPMGEIMKVEAQSVKNGEPVNYGLTVTAYVVDGRAADVWYSQFD